MFRCRDFSGAPTGAASGLMTTQVFDWQCVLFALTSFRDVAAGSRSPRIARATRRPGAMFNVLEFGKPRVVLPRCAAFAKYVTTVGWQPHTGLLSG